MRKVIGGFIGFCCAVTIFAANGPRHVENEGGFSFCAPSGWNFREFPGMKYQIAAGVAKDAFSPNMNVVDEQFAGSLKEYVDGNLQTMSKVFQQFKLIKRKAFTTSSGLKTEIVIINALQQNNLLRQTFLFVSNAKKGYFVVSCSCLEKDGDNYTKAFEESLKTFTIAK
jgi:hypothetical protein